MTIASVLSALWRASWQAAVIAAIVLVVQWVLRKQLSARWRHNLWLLVLLRLAIPVTPPAPFSLFNLTRHLSDASTSAIPLAPRITLDEAPAAAIETSVSKPFPWLTVLACVWAAGVLALATRTAIASIRLSRAVRCMKRVDDPKVLALLARCGVELGVATPPIVLTSPDLPAPALMGFLRPRLLLPAHVLADFQPSELRLIALHELAHLKRHDVAINWLMAILQAIHWFNPFLWLAFARLRVDRELAADELVLVATAEPDRHQYGETIVKLLQSLSHRPALPGTIGILERAHPLRRRITMIAQFHHHARRWTAVAACAMLALACLALTDAVRGDETSGKPATTQSAEPSSAAKAAIDRIKKSGKPFSEQELNAERESLAKSIRAKRLILASDGKPMNAGAVEAEVASAVEVFNAGLRDKTTSRPDASLPMDEERTYLEFQKRLPELNFQQIGFTDAIDFLRDVTGNNLNVNWQVFEAAGIDRNAPVTIRLRDVTFEQGLRQLLRQAGGGSMQLTFSLDGNIIMITTLEETHGRPRAYDIRDLISDNDGDAAKLEKLVMDNIPAGSWQEAGGTLGTINILGGRMIVNTADIYHLEIDRLLAELRKAK